jgi:hypothetical protein
MLATTLGKISPNVPAAAEAAGAGSAEPKIDLLTRRNRRLSLMPKKRLPMR